MTVMFTHIHCFTYTVPLKEQPETCKAFDSDSKVGAIWLCVGNDTAESDTLYGVIPTKEFF